MRSGISPIRLDMVGGGLGRGLGRGGQDTGRRGGDSQGVDGTEVHRKGRVVYAMDVTHSMLVEEVLKVANSLASVSASSAKSLDLSALVSGTGLVMDRAASSFETFIG